MVLSDNKSFEQKWGDIIRKKGGDEFSIFVPKGKKPETQRQFNLYHYYRLIDRLISANGYTSSVEFGCGRGTISLYLNLYNRMAVSLFDVSNDAVNLARANFDLHDGQGTFFVADSSRVPLGDGSFDLAVSIGLLEHLPNYVESLKEMHRVLKPGGMLITMNIPKKKSIQMLNDIYRKILRIFNKKIEMRKDYFRVADQPEDFLRNAQNVGFKNCRIIHANPFPIFVPIPQWLEKLLALKYRAIMAIRGLYRKEVMETGPRLAQCHFLIGFKPRLG